jgi:hypothetical protein
MLKLPCLQHLAPILRDLLILFCSTTTLRTRDYIPRCKVTMFITETFGYETLVDGGNEYLLPSSTVLWGHILGLLRSMKLIASTDITIHAHLLFTRGVDVNQCIMRYVSNRLLSSRPSIDRVLSTCTMRAKMCVITNSIKAVTTYSSTCRSVNLQSGSTCMKMGLRMVGMA